MFTSHISKKGLYNILFNTNSKSGKKVDYFLTFMIIFNIIIVMIESVEKIHNEYTILLYTIEWLITAIFTIEYISRILLEEETSTYLLSVFGIVDLLTIIPSYLSIFITGAQGFMIIRALRLLRVFRILKLNRNSQKSKLIIVAIKSSKDKIFLFLYAVVMIVMLAGTTMYLIEGSTHGFKNIPTSIYWALCIITTFHIENIYPSTTIGLTVESLLKVLAHIIVAVPTGIVTATILNNLRKNTNPLYCPNCHKRGHESDASHCKFCGEDLIEKYELEEQTSN